MNIRGVPRSKATGYPGPRALTQRDGRGGRLARPHADGGGEAVLREHLAAGRAEIRRRFEADPRAADSGRRLARETSFMIDQLIRAIYDFTTSQLYPLANPSEAEKIALVAVGGYGRSELAPFSDIDLLFLLPYKLTAHCEQVVEYILYRLWDLGLKVGQSARSIDECLIRAKGDLTIKTALLEARYLWGEQTLFDKFRKRWKVRGGAGRDLLPGQAQRAQVRHEVRTIALRPRAQHQGRQGGLRDLQTLRWIGRFLYNAETTDQLVEEGVLHARRRAPLRQGQRLSLAAALPSAFPARTGRDKLTFDISSRSARRLGYRDHAGNNRGRAADEALLPHRQVGGRADALLLHRSGGAASSAPSSACRRSASGRRELEGSAGSTAGGCRCRTPSISTSIRWTCCASSAWRRSTTSTSSP
jgi:[protein-PII] uridylyltransferase